MKKFKLKNNKNGFSLVELIVALGLFIVVMVISTGALLSLSDTNKKVQSMRIAFDNLNLALESMSREIRMGTVYHCDTSAGLITDARDCSYPGASSISFLSQDGEQTTYQLGGIGLGVIERIKGGVGPDAMTALEIDVNNLTFYVSGSSPVDPEQPVVIITVGGVAGVGVTSDFNIQTTVTSRIPG